MSQQKFKVTVSTKENYTDVPQDTVAAFSQRLTEGMKDVNRDFQKKQKKSFEKASQIVLNA